MYNCQIQEHDEKIEYICLYKECNQQRLCCNLCISSLSHEHNSFFMQYIDNYQVLNNFFNLSDKLSMNAQMIEHIVQQKIITIKTADEKLKPISIKKSRQNNCSEINLFKIQISNNKKLMVTQDSQMKIKIWCIQGFKLIKCINFAEQIKSMLFSEDEKYLFIGLCDQIVQLRVLNNFDQTYILNLESKGFYAHLKQTTNSILIYHYQTKIIKYDFIINAKLQLIDTGCFIQSLDIQSMTDNLITLNVQNSIKLWSSTGELILQKHSQEYYLQEDTSISFLGNKDMIVTNSSSRIIIWNLDYIYKTLYVQKLIYCSKMNRISQIWLNTKQLEIFIIRAHDICTYSIMEQNKVQTLKLNADYYDYEQASYHVLQNKNELIIIKVRNWNNLGLSQKFIVIKKRLIEM
ncbi:hypothetical protein pb186bvf_012308 [Paramecium bursaria]